MSQSRKTVRGSQPDGEDVRAALEAIWKEYGIAAEIRIFCELSGQLVVECIGDGYASDDRRVNVSRWERWLPLRYTLDVVMMRLVHQVYHAIGTDKATTARVRGVKG